MRPGPPGERGRARELRPRDSDEPWGPPLSESDAPREEGFTAKEERKAGVARQIRKWCRRPDSNRHGLPHTPLKRTCLPIPPRRHESYFPAGFAGAAGTADEGAAGTGAAGFAFPGTEGFCEEVFAGTLDITEVR